MKHAQAVVSQSLSLVFSTLALWPWMIAVPSQLSEAECAINRVSWGIPVIFWGSVLKLAQGE